MKLELHKYDIFPKVFPLGKHTVTIKPMGKSWAFQDDKTYIIHIVGMSERVGHNEYHSSASKNTDNLTTIELKANNEGNLVFTCDFKKEQEYFVRIFNEYTVTGAWFDVAVQLSIYAVEKDLAGRKPLIGDLHVHTTISDGAQSPEIVAAIYRENGYDFTAISDHKRFRGSLNARETYKDIKTDFLIVQGEEVHSPDSYVHIINFGSNYSVAALWEGNDQSKEVGDDPVYRALPGVTPPDMITEAQYFEEVDEISKGLGDIPEGVNGFQYAASVWVFNKIRQAGGLGVYCHPFWIEDTYNIPEKLHDFFVENAPFDAFEVVSDFDLCGLQALYYYEDRAKGRIYPVVGTSDSHNSLHVTTEKTGKTMVFSPKNEKDSIVQSIKDFYSVAIAVYKPNARNMIGSFRLAKYANFLYDNYFPIHDEICREEGRLMREYACGDQKAKERLNEIGMQIYDLRRKYFAW